MPDPVEGESPNNSNINARSNFGSSQGWRLTLLSGLRGSTPRLPLMGSEIRLPSDDDEGPDLALWAAGAACSECPLFSERTPWTPSPN